MIGPMGQDRVAGNVFDTLKRMGHDPIALGPARSRPGRGLVTRTTMLARQALPQLDERMQRSIARKSLDDGCEVVLNIDLYLMPNIVTRLRADGARVAFWFPDHVANLGRQLMFLAPYDALFFKEPRLVHQLRVLLDLPTTCLRLATRAGTGPMVPAGTEPYLVVPGNMYPYRVRLLERLKAKGIPLRLYGDGFPRWIGDTSVRSAHSGRRVFHEDKARVYRSAAGVLNSMFPAEIDGVNGRLFQAAGSGAAVLTEYRPALPDLFAIGEEVLAYQDFDDLIAQATRLLNEAGLTARVGDGAARRAHRDHTYDLRLAAILQQVT